MKYFPTHFSALQKDNKITKTTTFGLQTTQIQDKSTRKELNFLPHHLCIMSVYTSPSLIKSHLSRKSYDIWKSKIASTPTSCKLKATSMTKWSSVVFLQLLDIDNNHYGRYSYCAIINTNYAIKDIFAKKETYKMYNTH